MFERTARRIGLLGASAALLAACAGPGAATTAPATTTPATAAPATAAPATQAATGLTLALATKAAVGSYVTGANGMALYIFTKDSGSTSACTAQCADNWPPLIVAAASDVTAGAGVTGALGTITRDDGKLQVTLGGYPLYYFAADTAAGDLNGQAVGGVWYAAGADGTGLGMPGAATAKPGSSQCSGPTCY